MSRSERTLGLLGASQVGIGAIVGGGIFVLAGVAFSAAGPGAIIAFALNGIIAALTLLSFAEMSTAYPESGGAYTFGKRVLSIRLAFAMTHRNYAAARAATPFHQRVKPMGVGMGTVRSLTRTTMA